MTSDREAATHPHLRMAAALRRDIVYGHIPPGARIPRYDYADRYHVGPAAAAKVVKALQGEGLVREHAYTDYATTAGPSDPAVGARLGAVLTGCARRPAVTPPASLSATVTVLSPSRRRSVSHAAV
jgi:hypothetical protein